MARTLATTLMPASVATRTLVAARRSFFRRVPRGRVLAVKWGYNPNSSSLGVDITFLLFGLSIITFLTPLVGFLLRWHRPAAGPLTALSSSSSSSPGTRT